MKGSGAAGGAEAAGGAGGAGGCCAGAASGDASINANSINSAKRIIDNETSRNSFSCAHTPRPPGGFQKKAVISLRSRPAPRLPTPTPSRLAGEAAGAA